MKKNFKRLISTIATIAITASMFATFSITASATVEGDESNKAFDFCVIDNKFSEININSLKSDTPDGTTVLPPSPWTIKTSTYGWSSENAHAVRLSYKNIGGDAPYLKGLWTLDDTFGAPTNLKQINLTNEDYLSGNFAVELKYIPYQNTQYPDKNNNWFGAVANANQGFISIGVGGHKYEGKSNSYGEVYWNFGSENDSNFPIGILTNPCDMNTGAQAAYGQYTLKYNYASGSGVSPTIPSTTEELPEDFNGYHYARIEFTTDNGVTVLTRRGENTPWEKATATGTLGETMQKLRVPESNTQLIFRLHKGIIGVDSVKVYKFASDLENSVDSFEFTEDAEGLKATATLTNNNKADGWNVMLFTAIYNGGQLVSVEVTPDTIVKGNPKTISTPVDTSKYQEGYEIKAFLWEADSLSPLSGVLPLEQ